MGSLLSHDSSFYWGNTRLNRNPLISDLNDAITNCQQERDNIYITNSFYDTNNVLLTLWENDFNSFQKLYPWINVKSFQILQTLARFFRVNTPKNASSYQDISNEFPDQNTSLIGFNSPTTSPLVYDQTSWISFHNLHAAAFTFKDACIKLDYFLKYYKPVLRQPQNQINESIRQNQVLNAFSRVDLPAQQEDSYIHNQMIHIHFTDNSALNIDGSWKHNKRELTREEAMQLHNWGFKLPKTYYE